MTRQASAAIDIGGGGGNRDSGDSFAGSMQMTCTSYVNINIGSLNSQDPSGSSMSPENRFSVQDNASIGQLSLADNDSSLSKLDSFEKKEMFKDVVLLPAEQAKQVNNEESSLVEGGALMLTNYRLIFVKEVPCTVSIFPLMGLEQVDLKDPNQILLHTKEGRCQRIIFPQSESAIAWHRQLIKIMAKLHKRNSVDNTANDPESYELFAWKFSEAVSKQHPKWLVEQAVTSEDMVQTDFERLGMEEHFRVSSVNMDFKLTETYPERLIVPKCITDDDLKQVAPYRSMNRFPAVVWRSRETKAVLMRSAQARVGLIFYCRDHLDEKMVAEVAKSGCTDEEKVKQFVILDARTYTAALANHARGGGIEKSEYYQNAKIDFAGLPNIHAVRNSFVAVRNLLNSGASNESLHQELQTTGWMVNLSCLLRCSSNCADYLLNGQSVLVHCSDGWDRTTQIVSLAKLMLDEHYRTISGFEELIRREWLAFGHKFFDRQQNYNGNWEAGERAPIFVQFLEAVRHLQKEQPTAFQFTQAYLLKLAHHAYSGLFGTFMFNSMKERQEALRARQVPRLVEIWQYIGPHNEEYVNQTYDAEYKGALRSIKFTVLDLGIWFELFRDNNEKKKDTTDVVTETTQSPIKDLSLLERPASGAMTASTASTITSPVLTKSKSSESISSINNVEAQISHSHTPSLPHHSHPHQTGDSPNSSSILNGSLMSTSIQDPALQTIRQCLDHDGLLKFEDALQKSLRKKNAKQKEKMQKMGEVIKRKDQTIHDLQTRQRSVSEVLQNHQAPMSPPGSGSQCWSQHTSSSSRMQSVGEGESDVESYTLGRAPSDISVIGDHELPIKDGTGLQVDGKFCSSCNKKFTLLVMTQHCQKCLRKVCSACNQNKEHDSNGGRYDQRSICNTCYKEFFAEQSNRTFNHSLDESLSIGSIEQLNDCSLALSSVRSSSTTSLGVSSPKSAPIPINGQSPCKNETGGQLARSPTSDSFGSHMSSTQAVRG